MAHSDTHMPPRPQKNSLPRAKLQASRLGFALLPPLKGNAAAGASTTNAWVPDYLTEYRRSRPAREVLPARITGSAAIDWFLQTDWRREKIEPSRVCDDAAFVRRIYLDIAGRIPTSEEGKQFLGDARSDKRSRLIAALLASDDYARHMREMFDPVLMGRADDRTARARSGQRLEHVSGNILPRKPSVERNRAQNLGGAGTVRARTGARYNSWPSAKTVIRR